MEIINCSKCESASGCEGKLDPWLPLPPGGPSASLLVGITSHVILLAGRSGRGRSACGCWLQGSSEHKEGSPPPAACPAPSAPLFRGPVPASPSHSGRPTAGHSNNTREDSTQGHHQMVNTEIRLIIFFAAIDGEALYSQQKQDCELTVAQIMNSLLPNSDLN